MQKNTAVNRLKKVCILRLQVKQKIFTQTRIYTMLLSLCMTAKPWPYIISILSRHLPGISEGEDFAVAALEGFTQYAVEEGIIEDTVEQRAAITKAVVRAEFKLVVAGGNVLGYTAAATLLNHSLQDNPSNLSYVSTTDMAKQIAGSTECTTIVNQFKSDVTGTNYVRKTNSGTTTLNSTTDLHLAYNNVNYSATGVKSNGKWTLTITFTDTYDFDAQSWKNAMTDNALVTILNNYAAYAQSIGAIVPYNVTVTVQTTF